jgi:nucleoside-diphosphate kinase
MADEATLVVIKPEAFQRGLAGAVLSRLEALRLELIGAKVVRVTEQMARTHYDHLRDRPFFPSLLDHLQGKLHGIPYVLALVFRGPGAIARVREVTGATDPERADPRSIRGQFGRNTRDGLMENLLHASSDAEEAGREIALWFSPGELLARAPARAPQSRRR